MLYSQVNLISATNCAGAKIVSLISEDPVFRIIGYLPYVLYIIFSLFFIR